MYFNRIRILPVWPDMCLGKLFLSKISLVTTLLIYPKGLAFQITCKSSVTKSSKNWESMLRVRCFGNNWMLLQRAVFRASEASSKNVVLTEIKRLIKRPKFSPMSSLRQTWAPIFHPPFIWLLIESTFSETTNVVGRFPKTNHRRHSGSKRNPGSPFGVLKHAQETLLISYK